MALIHRYLFNYDITDSVGDADLTSPDIAEYDTVNDKTYLRLTENIDLSADITNDNLDSVTIIGKFIIPPIYDTVDEYFYIGDLLINVLASDIYICSDNFEASYALDSNIVNNQEEFEFALTYDGNNELAKLYINGDYKIDVNPNNPPLALDIIQITGTTQDDIPLTRDIRIYDTALTDIEIQAVYNETGASGQNITLNTYFSRNIDFKPINVLAPKKVNITSAPSRFIGFYPISYKRNKHLFIPNIFNRTIIFKQISYKKSKKVSISNTFNINRNLNNINTLVSVPRVRFKFAQKVTQPKFIRFTIEQEVPKPNRFHRFEIIQQTECENCEFKLLGRLDIAQQIIGDFFIELGRLDIEQTINTFTEFKIAQDVYAQDLKSNILTGNYKNYKTKDNKYPIFYGNYKEYLGNAFYNPFIVHTVGGTRYSNGLEGYINLTNLHKDPKFNAKSISIIYIGEAYGSLGISLIFRNGYILASNNRLEISVNNETILNTTNYSYNTSGNITYVLLIGLDKHKLKLICNTDTYFDLQGIYKLEELRELQSIIIASDTYNARVRHLFIYNRFLDLTTVRELRKVDNNKDILSFRVEQNVNNIKWTRFIFKQTIQDKETFRLLCPISKPQLGDKLIEYISHEFGSKTPTVSLNNVSYSADFRPYIDRYYRGYALSVTNLKITINKCVFISNIDKDITIAFLYNGNIELVYREAYSKNIIKRYISLDNLKKTYNKEILINYNFNNGYSFNNVTYLGELIIFKGGLDSVNTPLTISEIINLFSKYTSTNCLNIAQSVSLLGTGLPIKFYRFNMVQNVEDYIEPHTNCDILQDKILLSNKLDVAPINLLSFKNSFNPSLPEDFNISLDNYKQDNTVLQKNILEINDFIFNYWLNNTTLINIKFLKEEILNTTQDTKVLEYKAGGVEGTLQIITSLYIVDNIEYAKVKIQYRSVVITKVYLEKEFLYKDVLKYGVKILIVNTELYIDFRIEDKREKVYKNTILGITNTLLLKGSRHRFIGSFATFNSGISEEDRDRLLECNKHTFLIKQKVDNISYKRFSIAQNVQGFADSKFYRIKTDCLENLLFFKELIGEDRDKIVDKTTLSFRAIIDTYLYPESKILNILTYPRMYIKPTRDFTLIYNILPHSELNGFTHYISSFGVSTNTNNGYTPVKQIGGGTQYTQLLEQGFKTINLQEGYASITLDTPLNAEITGGVLNDNPLYKDITQKGSLYTIAISQEQIIENNIIKYKCRVIVIGNNGHFEVKEAIHDKGWLKIIPDRGNYKDLVIDSIGFVYGSRVANIALLEGYADVNKVIECYKMPTSLNITQVTNKSKPFYRANILSQNIQEDKTDFNEEGNFYILSEAIYYDPLSTYIYAESNIIGQTISTFKDIDNNYSATPIGGDFDSLNKLQIETDLNEATIQFKDNSKYLNPYTSYSFSLIYKNICKNSTEIGINISETELLDLTPVIYKNKQFTVSYSINNNNVTVSYNDYLNSNNSITNIRTIDYIDDNILIGVTYELRADNYYNILIYANSVLMLRLEKVNLKELEGFRLPKYKLQFKEGINKVCTRELRAFNRALGATFYKALARYNNMLITLGIIQKVNKIKWTKFELAQKVNKVKYRVFNITQEVNTPIKWIEFTIAQDVEIEKKTLFVKRIIDVL